jgi:hypothetical protein
MIKNKPQTALSQSILEAIIRKADFTFMQGENYYRGDDFIWQPDADILDFPTLVIFSTDVECPVVNLYWNINVNEEFEIESNIPWSAEENLQFYIKLEKTVFPILEKIQSEMVDIIELPVPEIR